MPDYFEVGVVAGRKAAWHGKAIRPEGKEVLTAGEMLKLVPELDSDVDQREVAYRNADGGWTIFDDRVANVREVDDKAIGMVGKDYKVVSPKRLFSFLDELVQVGAAAYESAFTMKGGSEVALLLRRPDDVLIGGHEEERMQRYLCCVNGYDTWGQARGLQVFWTDVRVECWNTMMAAIRGVTTSFSVSHTGDMEGKIAQARNVLDLSFKHDEQFEQLANKLISEPFTKRDLGKLLDRLTPFQIPKQDTDRKAENREYAKQAIVDYFLTAPNLTETPTAGTKWAAWNAIIEYSDWDRPVVDRGDGMGRFRRITVDTGLKTEALELLVA